MGAQSCKGMFGGLKNVVALTVSGVSLAASKTCCHNSPLASFCHQRSWESYIRVYCVSPPGARSTSQLLKFMVKHLKGKLKRAPTSAPIYCYCCCGSGLSAPGH